MDSRTGKKIRMARFFNQQSGNALLVAYSHGVIMGPLSGMMTLAEMEKACDEMAAVDGLMVAPGMLPQLEDYFIGRDKPALMVHMDYQSYVRETLPYDQGATVGLASVEQALAAGADGIMTYLYIGHTDPEIEKQEIERNARLARECERLGMVFMVEALSAQLRHHPEHRTDIRIQTLGCRIAAELGADMVKAFFPGSLENVSEMARTCPPPLLLAGGAKAADPEEAFSNADDAIRAGAAGLVFGRNIFEADDVRATVQRYREIVHGDAA
ncbi:MAG: class I fructose-bisphosphate aldolase [Halocynthiibacter sp.]